MNKPTLKREDLATIRERTARELDDDAVQTRVTVHMGTCGIASGAEGVMAALLEEVEASGREDVEITSSGCIGLCSMEPLITVERRGETPIIYHDVDKISARKIFWRHVVEGKVQHSQALARGLAIDERPPADDPHAESPIPRVDQLPFFGSQRSTVLRNKGLIDPERIDHAIWRGGYEAAAKALLEMTPQEIVEEVKRSGLRGRGGAGFPTGLKWQMGAASRGELKYVLCNADEGDPGAFMDRAVMEGDPHAVIEGMIIAAKAIGAKRGVIYCRAEYPLAIKRLNIALDQARDLGLLGQDILGSGFDFDVTIYKGAGAFVCGEETALMASIEGRRGTPRPRPPFPVVSGLWGKPSVLNNVETYANVPVIISGGGEAFAEIGTESSKGTKVFALTGKVERVGLVEVPMGTPLGQIVFDIGGGVPKGKKFKALQLGGPSGGCLPSSALNVPTDYEAIAKAGAIMGSGGMIVVDEDTCMVDLARFFMTFCEEESCGTCSPCRIGTRRMREILERICRGQGQEGDIELLEELGRAMTDSALCGLGQTAANPVMSTLRYFRHEYEEHLRERRCRATVCRDLFASPCQHACPAGMDVPGYVALIADRRLDDAMELILRTNPLPSVCGRVCGHPCQEKCQRGQLDEPVAIMHLKRFVADNASRPRRINPLPPVHPERVAIVGAGPSGLAAASELRHLGYAVSMYEALPEAGGMLRYGIPPYRLPRDILDRDIQAILDLGVALKTGVSLGRELDLEVLEQENDAVYLAFGAHRNVKMGIPGEEADGVLGGAEFLRHYNLGSPLELGLRVAVLGGGNTAIDAARTAIRLGAETVAVYYRRRQEDMPALRWEIDAALEEGVRIDCNLIPLRVQTYQGRVIGLELARVALGEFDESARRRPRPIVEKAFSVKVDTVIAAVGHDIDSAALAGLLALDLESGALVADREGRTSRPGVWAGGDAVTGPAMVIDAIAAGRRAARSIDRALRAKKGEPATERSYRPIQRPRGAPENPGPQQAVPVRRPSERRRDFQEVELGYTLEQAIAEASRCARCDARQNPEAERIGGER